MRCGLIAVCLGFAGAAPAAAQLAGEPFIHDPSTVTLSDGKYYTFGTRGGGLVSEDGWTWHGGPERPGGGVAPDASGSATAITSPMRSAAGAWGAAMPARSK